MKNNNIVSEYINQLQEATSKYENCIFRGQPQKYEGVKSTFSRRFHKSKKENPTQSDYIEYHKDLIRDARSYHYKEGGVDIELLMELQHYGAATGLIDFTEDALIALWFACQNNDEDGYLFFLDVWNDKFEHIDFQAKNGEDIEALFSDTQIYFIKNNFKSNNRIFAQKAVFLFTHKNINNIYNLGSITIKKADKDNILETLKRYFAIEEKTLFQDIYGFAQVNNLDHKLTIKTSGNYFQEAFDETDPEKQVKLYEEITKRNPNNSNAHNNMGVAYAKLEEYDKAIVCYQKAIKINPEDYEAYYNMGIAYAKLEEYDKAIVCYQKAININPKYYEAYNNMGIAYGELGEHDKAIVCYQKAININPEYTNAHYNLSNVYQKLEQYDKAIACYQKAININPEYADAHFNLGNVYQKLEQYDKAIACYQKAININPKFADAHYNLGNVYEKLKQYDKAIEFYKKAMDNNPSPKLLKHANKQNWDALENWANSLTDTNQQKNALQVLRQLKGNKMT